MNKKAHLTMKSNGPSMDYLHELPALAMNQYCATFPSFNRCSHPTTFIANCNLSCKSHLLRQQRGLFTPAEEKSKYYRVRFKTGVAIKTLTISRIAIGIWPR